MDSIDSISEFSVTVDLIERVSVYLYGPTKLDNQYDFTDYIQLSWDSSIYNEE
jgi:hypothetical protein